MRSAWVVIAGLVSTLVLWSVFALAVPSRSRTRADGRANPQRSMGAATIVSSYSGSLDGVNDYFTAGDIATTDGATKVTWMVWFYEPSWPGSNYPQFWYKYTTNQGHFAFAQWPVAGVVRFYIPSSVSDVSNYWTSANGTFANATWYHLVIAYDGTASGNANRLRVYRNGTQLTDGTYNGTIPASLTSGTTSPMTFAMTSGTVFGGFVDEAAIWSGLAMTQAQINEAYNAGVAAIDLNTLTLSPKPTHYWRFENNGTDIGLSPANLTATNGATYSATVPW